MSRDFIVDDSDRNIIYNASWTNGTVVGPSSNEFWNTTHYSAAPGDMIRYQWEGTRISVYGTLDRPAVLGSPNATFSVDGGPASFFNDTGTINPSDGAAITSHVLFYQSSMVTQGTHTISITLLAPPSSGAGAPPTFYFDFFTVSTGCYSPFSLAIVDDRDRSVVYDGTWIDMPNASNYMQASHQLTKGSATFSFYGTDIAVFGTPSPETSVVFEGSAANYTFPYDRPLLPHTMLFRNSSLSDTENHSIIMHNYDFGTINGTRWSLDYIVYNIGNSPASGASENCRLAVLGDTTVESDGGRIAKIVGGVFGGLGGLLLLAIVALYMCYKWRRSRPVLAQETPATSLGPDHVPGVNNIISLAHLHPQGSDRRGENEGDGDQPVTEDDPAGRRANHIQEIGTLRLQGG